MTPEQEVARKNRAVAAAKALLSLEHGLAYGATRVRGLLWQLGSEVTKQFPAFDRFLAAIPKEIPLGQVRLLCQEKLLFESDRVLAAVEAEFRQMVLRECLEVIRVYG